MADYGSPTAPPVPTVQTVQTPAPTLIKLSAAQPVPITLPHMCSDDFSADELHVRILHKSSIIYSGYGYDAETIKHEYNRPCHKGIWKPIGISKGKDQDWINHIMYFGIDYKTAEGYASPHGVIHVFRVLKDCYLACVDTVFADANETNTCICTNDSLIKQGFSGSCVTYARDQRNEGLMSTAELALCDPESILEYVCTDIKTTSKQPQLGLDSIWPFFNPANDCEYVPVRVFCDHNGATIRKPKFKNDDGQLIDFEHRDGSICRQLYEMEERNVDYQTFVDMLVIKKTRDYYILHLNDTSKQIPS